MSEPVAKAILLANYAIQDKLNRWTLTAVFDNVYLPSLPGHVPPFYVFARLADAPRTGRFTVQLEDPGGVVLWTSGAQLFELADPKDHNLAIVLPTAPVVVCAFGKYRVAIYVGADRLADTELSIVPAEERVVR